MKKHKRMFWLGLLFVLFVGSMAYADFYPEEKPVGGLTQDTAYLLNKGEWYIDFYGWTTYGVADNMQIGSNFWADVAQLRSWLRMGLWVPSLSARRIYY